ncbi:ABC transporter ATP-binding protein [Desulfurivibrio sp. D14AmB]|uniref:ABC transporter ATP-binding protein n=1 Tax=Desulfurivibrio sp. D14AmB TaxID=3374370 RepID=UPI00376F2BA6
MTAKPTPHEPDPEQDDQGYSAPLGHYLWKIFPFVAPYKVRIGIGLVLNALARLFDLLPLVLIGWVVDAIAARGAGETSSTIFVWFGLAVLGTFLALAVFQSISDYCLDSMAQEVRHDLRMAVYARMQTLDAGFFEERQTGDLLAVASNDVDNLEHFFSDITTNIVRLVITFVGVYGFLFWLDWRLALLLIAPLPVAVVAVRFFATRVQPQYRKARRTVGEINSILENNIRGIGVIQAFTAEEEQLRRLSRRSREYVAAAISAARERAKFIPLIYLVAGVAFALLISVGAWLTATEHGPSLGNFTTFVLFAVRLVFPLFIFGMLINQIQRSEASARRISRLLTTAPVVRDHSQAEELAGAPARISLRNVGFEYRPGRLVLRKVGFELERGRVLGIVGPTGAGKSTLVKLLLRYYDPATGEILVNGRPLTRLKLESYRRHVGYVSQEAFLFFGSVAENIRLGSPGAGLEAVREAARIAGAAEFIDQLPEQYDTMIGERGLKLSGGQRQRISLARAVLRDPALIVLDEATSAVDTRTEELIQANLLRFRRGRMTVAVAHRLSTIRHCDEILVLVDGTIAERGTHEALLARSGVYAGLWRVQSGENGEL